MIVDALPTGLPPGIWGVDIETTMRNTVGTVANPFEDEIVVIGVSNGKDTYIVCKDFTSVAYMLGNPEYTICMHNAWFDMAFLVKQAGVKLCSVEDTLIAERLLNAGDNRADNSLEGVLARRVNVVTDKGVRTTFTPGELTPEQERYVATDVQHLPEIYRQQQAELQAEGLLKTYHLEMDVLPVIVDMYLRGIPLDVEAWKDVQDNLADTMDNLYRQMVEPLRDMPVDCPLCDGSGQMFDDGFMGTICVVCDGRGYVPTYTQNGPYIPDKEVVAYREYCRELTKTEPKRDFVYAYKRCRERDIAVEASRLIAHTYVTGESHDDYLKRLWCNPDSPQQVMQLLKLFELDVPNTRRETIEELIASGTVHPFLDALLDWRTWSKLASWDYEKHINPVTGLIHPEWKQVRADTGRMSCTEPNMTNVPRPKPNQPNLRALFPPREGYDLVVADYSQQEIRVLAEVANDYRLRAAAKDSDVYMSAARIIYGQEVDRSSDERQIAKTVVLAIAYGARPKRLARVLNISFEEAQGIYNQIAQAFPVMMRWGEQQVNTLRATGYTTTMWGRKRKYPEVRRTKPEDMWKYGLQARNMPIQGTSADMTKRAMVRIWQRIEDENLDAFIRQAVHDELVVEAAEDISAYVEELVIEEMVAAGNEMCPNVTILAESQRGKVWTH